MTRVTKDWWRGAVIYQIYPRSFYDTNGDGIGDLPGIMERLDYIAQLGAEAIWISPFFTSPMRDFGYDIADYTNVDPMFGTLADFDAVIAKAHALGLKVIVDQVPSHSSDEHPWFKESRANRDNPKADWYVWADPKPDGSPPNNWLSIFGGVAWKWESRRRQYYLHNFLESQPDLNFHNPEVRNAVLGVMEFWLKRGVDGFRLDAVDFYYHDKQLRDNPPLPKRATGEALPDTNPYGYQEHLYDKGRPENLAFLEEVRRLLDRYNAVAVGEIGSENALDLIGDCTRRDLRLHMVYTFNLLGKNFSAGHIRGIVETTEAKLGDGWACWAFSNHDVVRVVSRWGASLTPKQRPLFAQAMLMLLTTLRGSYCLHQGEELGLPEADIPYEKIRDPYGLAFWPEFKGRDGCRTPLPWSQEAPHGGFSSTEPWLPVPDEHRALAIDIQERAGDSTLHFARKWLGWRKQQPALLAGSLRFIDTPEPVLAFVREEKGQALVIAFNLRGEPVKVALPLPSKRVEAPGATGRAEGETLSLPAFGVYIGAL